VWLLATGKVSTIDTGLLKVAGGRGRHFVHAATVGVNVAFVRLATQQVPLRRPVRRFAYVVAAARALHQRESFPCELHYDGKVDRFELIHLSAINTPVFGGFLDLRVTGTHLGDRLLDVVAIEHLPIHRLALAAVQWLAGRTASVQGIHTRRVNELRVGSSCPLELALDGEIAGVLPAEFAVAGNALRVITPHEFEDNDD
ncbi:MAG: diacylglycerol/lipid kinase family protein, partial [Mycobacteriaceae bacterium]